jgi:hypothetical protein
LHYIREHLGKTKTKGLVDSKVSLLEGSAIGSFLSAWDIYTPNPLNLQACFDRTLFVSLSEQEKYSTERMVSCGTAVAAFIAVIIPDTGKTINSDPGMVSSCVVCFSKKIFTQLVLRFFNTSFIGCFYLLC